MASEGINAIRPWMSSVGIDKGARWGLEVSARLSKSNFGIICLTSENLHNDWILFEAGALSKSIDGARACTFLVDVKHADVEFPLAQFQHTTASKEDVLGLLKTINSALGEAALSEQHLNEALDVWWPKLESALDSLPSNSAPRAERSDRELLEELLSISRDNSQSLNRRTLVNSTATRRRLVDKLFELAQREGFTNGTKVHTISNETVTQYTLTANDAGVISIAIPHTMRFSEARAELESQFVTNITKMRAQRTLDEAIKASMAFAQENAEPSKNSEPKE